MKVQSIGRIACHAKGKSYLFPITYIYNDGNVFCYGHEGLKMSMMRANKEVCFEVDSIKSITDWKSVIAWGKFEEVKDDTERNRLLSSLIERTTALVGSVALEQELDDDYPYLPTDPIPMEGVVFKLILNEKTGRFTLTERTPDWMSYDE